MYFLWTAELIEARKERGNTISQPPLQLEVDHVTLFWPMKCEEELADWLFSVPMNPNREGDSQPKGEQTATAGSVLEFHTRMWG